MYLLGLTDTEVGNLIKLLNEAREARKKKIIEEPDPDRGPDEAILELATIDRMIHLFENFVYYVPIRD